MTRRGVVPAVGMAVAIVAALVWLRAGNQPEADSASETLTVAPRTFAATVVAVGAVKPQIGAEVRVGSQASGRVHRLRANVGDQVQAGDVIAELETAEFDALVAERRAEVALAEAKRRALTVLAPDETARAQADVARFEAEVQLATEESERQQTLLASNLAPRASAAAARDRLAVASAELEAARRALDLVRAGNMELRTQAEADVARARATLDSALVDRSFAVLTAPISGVVASVATQEGETVSAGLNAPTFVTIVDLDRLQVNAFVDEVDIGKVSVGQRVTFVVDAFPARDFTGRVAAIYPTATIQDNVVKYIVAVDLDGDPGGMLRPEMTASVRIELEAREVLAVPARAVRQAGGRSAVVVLVEGRPELRPVRLGWRDGAWTEVVEGLAAGDRILVDAP